MATVKMTVYRNTPGGGRTDTPENLIAGRVAKTATMTSAATNKLFSNADDVDEAAGIVGDKGETVVIQPNGGTVAVASAIGTDPDATSEFHHWVSSIGVLIWYCDRDDTRFAVVDA